MRVVHRRVAARSGDRAVGAVMSEAWLRGHIRRGTWLLRLNVFAFAVNVWGATTAITGGPSAIGAWFQPLAVVMNVGVAVWIAMICFEMDRQLRTARGLLEQHERMRRLFG